MSSGVRTVTERGISRTDFAEPKTESLAREVGIRPPAAAAADSVTMNFSSSVMPPEVPEVFGAVWANSALGSVLASASKMPARIVFVVI